MKITKEKSERILDNLIKKTGYQGIVWDRDYELFYSECYYIRSHKGLTGFDLSCANQYCRLEYVDLRSNTKVVLMVEQYKLQKLYNKIKTLFY